MRRLSELCRYDTHVDVWVDGYISDIGYVDTDIPCSLVHAGSDVHLGRALANDNVSCILTTGALAAKSTEIKSGKGVAICASPRDVFYALHERWLSEGCYRYPTRPGRGADCQIDPTAFVAPEAELGDRVIVGPNVVVTGPVRIGSDCRLDAAVRVGVEGILYTTRNGIHRPVRHGGWVDVEPHVTLHSGATVSRSVHPSEPTVIGTGTIVGINAIIGHDARVGRGVVVSGQTVIARRARVGDGAYLGTHAFIREHVVVASDARIMAGAIVIDDVSSRAVVSGNFAESHHRRMMHHVKNQRP